MINLNALDKYNFKPKSILDIGCQVGRFYKQCKNKWGGDIDYYLIDGNENVREDLEKLNVPFNITLLSDRVKTVTWYVDSKNLKSGGNSYYRENTEYFSDENVIEAKKETETLDSLFTDKSFDLIKMDTQGSEMDIIKGGLETCKSAKFLILEIALTQYNEGAPLKNEMLEFLEKIGFKQMDILDNHRRGGKLIQQDILFRNKNIN